MRWLKRPKIDRKTGKQVGYYYQFRRYNQAKRRYDPVPVDGLPLHIKNCTTDEEAEAYANSMSAEEDALKHRTKLRVLWKIKFNDWNDLLTEFTEYHKKTAPNSYDKDVDVLDRYVFPWFLGKEYNNVETWHLHYSKFRSYLETVKTMKGKRENLSINFQNAIVKGLNRFIDFMIQTKGLSAVPKCKSHPRHMARRVSADDLWEKEEIVKICRYFKDNNRDTEHDLFLTLLATGMRISEAVGLSVSFIVPGKIEGQKLSKIHEQLKIYELTDYSGYICLESQIALEKVRTDKKYTAMISGQKFVWEMGEVPRAPLKLRRSIAPQFYRYIPIFDEGVVTHLEGFDVWKLIAKRYNTQLDLMESKNPPYGNEGHNYLIFDGVNGIKFYQELLNACRALKIRPRSPHDCRHTFLTWLYDVTTEDRYLSKKIAGHEDERSMANYSHINELMGREQAQKVQLKKRIKTDD